MRESDFHAQGETLQNMSPHSAELNKVGRHFLIGLQKSHELTEHDVRLLTVLQPAGIILFRENFKRGVPYREWLACLRELIDSVRECVQGKPILISVDHECGTVFRPPPPITNFGPAAKWAKESGKVGAAMGVELRSMGINLNYAPVVDINTNPQNPVIGNRAFGATPEVVSESARNFVSAIENEGVIACPKHFPGHGDTRIDSHYGLPIVESPLEELRRRELLPFAAMVQAGAKIIMSAHIVFPGIDPASPATMSRRFLSDILRGEMGFQGVITSDDIGMGAVSALFEKPDSAAKTIEAGCDLIMMSAHWTDTNRCLALAQDLLASLDGGAADYALYRASQKRIDTLLSNAPAYSVHALPDETFAAHRTISKAY
jgi:beta-N-acetylhexosaminidase